MLKAKYNLIFLALLALAHADFTLAGELHAAGDADILRNDDAILGLWINGIDQHRDAMLSIVDKKHYIECSVLQSNFMDLDKFQQISQGSISYCLISNPEIEISEDQDLQLVKIDIPASYMLSQNIGNIKIQMPELPGLGGFINYDLFYQGGDYSEQANAVADLGIFWRNTFLNSSHIFRKNTNSSNDLDAGHHTRLNTTLTFEFPKKLANLQIGDVVSTNTGLTQSYYFGGFRWGTNFVSRPDFIYWNTPSLKGSALVPSTIDLIINGNKAYNSKINPGEFNIDSNINFRGLGSADMIVQDIMGNRTVQNIPIFVSERLLKKGLTDYSFSAGKIRYNYSEASDDYREWFASGYFRHGLSSSTTLGAISDYSHDLSSTGILWSQYLYKLGLLEVNSAYSNDHHNDGFTVSTEFKRDYKLYSFGLKYQYYSRDFKMLGMEDDSFLPEQENLLYFSKSAIPFLGNLSLTYIDRLFRDDSERENERIFSIRSSRSLFDNLNMSVGFSYDAINQDNNRVDLSLSYRFDDKNAAYFNQTDSDSTNLTFVKNSSNAVGVDYSVGGGRSNDENTGNVATRLKSKAGDLDLQYLKTGDQNNYSAAFHGALTWLGSSVDLTKSVNNGFSLVKVTDSPNIDVYRNDLFIGKTNKHGEIFVHDLIAYTNQHVSFNENQLQIEDKVSTARKSIMPLNKRGYIVEFPVIHTKEVDLKLVDLAGKPIVKGSQVTLDGNMDDIYPIGSDDVVTVYGLTAGVHQLHVQMSASETCTVDFELKYEDKSKEPLQLVCK
ncbi:MAG: fimbria/pilus outer membrane usher protein [Acinetobacter sp.]